MSKKRLHIVLIVLLSYVFFFHGLGSYSLKEPDEGRYAEIPREMVETGDYIVPHLDYVRYFEKPPLLYWTTALSFKIFGFSEYTTRLPDALAALVTALFLYAAVARWFTPEIGLLSAVMLVTSFGFFTMARTLTIDMLLSCMLFLSLIFFYDFYREKRRAAMYGFYACLALATLAKGPVAPLLVGVTLLLYLIMERKILFLRMLLNIKGLLLYIAITAPWFVAIALREKEFLWFFFMDQNFLRFLTQKHHRSGPIYYFLPVLFGGLFPWSIFIPRAVAASWRKKELRLFLIWFFVVFLFFSLSGSKLPPYILPAFPALALLLGWLFGDEGGNRVSGRGEIFIYQILFGLFGLAGFAVAAGAVDSFLRMQPEMLELVKGLKGFSIAVVCFSVVPIVLLCLRKMRAPRPLFLILSCFSLAVIVLMMMHTGLIDKVNTTKELAAVINREKSGGTLEVVNFASFDETLPFYTRQKIYIAGYKGELEMGSAYEDTKDTFLSIEEFVNLFRSDRKVLCVLKATRLSRLRDLGIENVKVLACQSGRCLISNGR
ncbi:MAG TPA: glycosyltransferase family 39 protein [Syntrophorhabdales bacterium]|nr:glycosyltransferase family 39 protein [Syntrophorhabdales bacterium]